VREASIPFANFISGLSVADFTTVSIASQIIILCLMMAGSTAIASITPTLLRYAIIRYRLAKGTPDVDPQRTETELGSMKKLARVVAVYSLVNIAVVFIAGGFYTQFAGKVGPAFAAANVGPWYASIFIAVRLLAL
jgi:hypothetical protein